MNLKLYKLKKNDFEAIEKILELVFKNKLKFIFPKGGLEKIDIETFDSTFIYLFSKNNYPLPLSKKFKSKFTNLYQIPHKRKLKEKDYKRAFAGLSRFSQIKKINPFPLISCPPLNAYLSVRDPSSPYSFKESYLPTLVHEYGHIYYELHRKKDYFNLSKKDFYKLVEASFLLWKGKPAKVPLISIPPPVKSIGELFANLAEFTFAEKFCKKHLINWKRSYLKEFKDPQHFFEKRYDIYHFVWLFVPIIKKLHPDWNEWLLKLEVK